MATVKVNRGRTITFSTAAAIVERDDFPPVSYCALVLGEVKSLQQASEIIRERLPPAVIALLWVLWNGSYERI